MAAVAGLAMVIVVGLQSMGAHSENVGLLLSAVFGSAAFYPLIKDQLPARGRKPLKPSPDLTIGVPDVDLYWSPWLVLIVVVAALQVLERLGAALVAVAVETGYSAFGLPINERALVLAAVTAAGLVALIVQAIIIAPIAYWATHRLETRSFLWVAAAILLTQSFSVAVAHLFIGYASLGEALVHFALGALLLPGAVLGVWVGERSRLDYAISLVSSRLSTADQLDMLEIARQAGQEKPPLP